MNGRPLLLVLLPSLTLVATSSFASILSPSGKSLGKGAGGADYLDVTTFQNDLNASLNDIAVGGGSGSMLPFAAPELEGTGVGSRSVSGGFLIGSSASSSPTFSPFAHSAAVDDLFDEQMGIPVDPHDEFGILGRPGGGGGDDDEWHGGWRRGRPGGPHAAPEPSTWLLLGSSLMCLGVWVGVRRRSISA